jgi:hypothetical protein
MVATIRSDWFGHTDAVDKYIAGCHILRWVQENLFFFGSGAGLFYPPAVGAMETDG